MIRRLVAGLIVVGLAVGVWLVWPKADQDPTTTTALPDAVATTTTTTVLVTTSTMLAETTSSSGESHVVTTVEEAEAILRELWFGWFEGIYNQDEDRIREVVGTQAFLSAGLEAMDSLGFNEIPTRDAIKFDDLQVLQSDETCLAVWVTASAPFVETSTDANSSVDVARWAGDRWVLVSTWQFKEDMWEPDCEAGLEPLS